MNIRSTYYVYSCKIVVKTVNIVGMWYKSIVEYSIQRDVIGGLVLGSDAGTLVGFPQNTPLLPGTHDLLTG